MISTLRQLILKWILLDNLPLINTIIVFDTVHSLQSDTVGFGAIYVGYQIVRLSNLSIDQVEWKMYDQQKPPWQVVTLPQQRIPLFLKQGEERPAFKHMFKVKHFLGFKHDHYVWIWGYAWIPTLHSDHMSQPHSWTQIPTKPKWKNPKDHLIYYWIQIILHECYRFYTILPFDTSLCVTCAYVIMKTIISYIGTIIC